jgi:hypothetical protein
LGTGNSEPGTPSPTRRAPNSRVAAERWILGCLLIEPSRWFDIQRHILLDDFTDPKLKSLADLYWTHQRDEGEIAFNEFLSLLKDPALAQLAIELVDIAQTFPDPQIALQGALDALTKEKERAHQQKLLAELRRKGVIDSLPEQAEVDILKQLQDRKKQPPPTTPPAA